MKLRQIAIVTLVIAATSVPVLAQGRPPARPDTPQWSFGLGVVSSPAPYVDADNRVFPIPVIGLRYKRLVVQGVRAGYVFYEKSGFSLAAGASMRFMGYEANDSPALVGMADRDFSVDAVLGADWDLGRFSLEGVLRRDLLGRSDGLEAELSVFYWFFLADGKLRLRPSLGGSWQDRNLVDYYYGVRPEEAIDGRPAYAGASSISGNATLFFFYSLSPRWMISSFVRYQVLGSEITDSPIVGRDAAFSGLLGLTYNL